MIDILALEEAYRELLEVARGGPFRPPAEAGDWPAELVLAHVATNDRLLAATTALVLAGSPARYDNAAASVEAGLHALARAAGDFDGLVATARQTGLELVLLLRQLTPEQSATAVSTRIMDGEDVRLDGTIPWSGVINTHAEVHLRSHIDRLRELQA